MRNIKYFQYKNMREFERFLNKCKCGMWKVTGFKFSREEHYNGNILKVYSIYFKDGSYKYFKVAFFKSIFECDKARLGVINNKLLMWYDDANVRKYKVKDIWGLKDKYVIEN